MLYANYKRRVFQCLSKYGLQSIAKPSNFVAAYYYPFFSVGIELKKILPL